MIRKNRLINVKIIRPYWKCANFDCLYYSYFYWTLKIWIAKTSITFKLTNKDKVFINDVEKIF